MTFLLMVAGCLREAGMSAFQTSTDAPDVAAGLASRVSQSAHSSITAGTKPGWPELQELEPLLKGKNMHQKAVRYVNRTTAAAASTLAATASSVAAAALAASIILSPAADASVRMDGVHTDLARAVQLNQVTAEQAADSRQGWRGGFSARPEIPRILAHFWPFFDPLKRRFDSSAEVL